MNERIKKLRKELGLTQQAFANILGVSRNNIAGYEAVARNPSDSAIALICKTFNVNEDWLRNGTGDMFEKLSKEEQVAALLGKVFTDKDSEIYDFKLSVFKKLGLLEKEDWEVIRKIVDGISKK